MSSIPLPRKKNARRALLLDVDPIALVRGGRDTATLDHYVNDRPYVAGSMLAVAIGAVFRTAMAGVSAAQELADSAIPLDLHLPVVPTRGDVDLVTRMFAPLGWDVVATALPMDPQFPEWGDAPYVDLRLSGTLRLADALKHLYVLLPVLDNAKHYWVNEDEIEKLLRAGDGWLGEHPERELISRRYLRHRETYVRSALARLAEADDMEPGGFDDAMTDALVTEEPERTVPLAERRRDAVVAMLTELGAHRVIDMGCGSGALLRELGKHPEFSEVVGIDVSAGALGAAARAVARMPQTGQSAVHPAPVGADVRRPRPRRLRRRGAHGGRRARRRIPPARAGAERIRLRQAECRHRDHPQRRVQRALRDAAGRPVPPPGPPVRVDPRGVPAVGRRPSPNATATRSRYRPIGDDDPEVGPPTQAAVFEVVR